MSCGPWDFLRSFPLETQRIALPEDDNDNGDVTPRRQLDSGITLFKRYLIQDVIGVGGMGSVPRP